MIKIKHNIDDLTDEILEELPSKSSSSSAKNSYIQEIYFQTKAYEQKNIKPVSFSLSNQHYGKLDNNLMSLVPNENKLKTINSENDLQVLDFVADAYFAFIQEFNSFKLSNRFSSKSKIYNFEAKGSKEDLEEKYDLFLSDQYSYFLDFVNTNKLHKSITNINSFISVFSSFIDSRTPLTPYNKSSFLLSTRVSRKVTGLVIDLDEADSNDDLVKYNNYINNEDFECFQDLVQSFGFVINKDLPWQIVANLDSVNMKYYFHLRMLRLVEEGMIQRSPVPTNKRRFEECKDVLENFDLTKFVFESTSDLKYFKILNYNDLNNLKNLIYYFYNSYVEYKPKNTTTKIIKTSSEFKFEQQTQQRRLVGLEELETEEMQKKIIKLYVFMKAREVNSEWSQNKFNSVVTKTIQTQKALDTERALEYLQRELVVVQRSQVKQKNFFF